MKKHFVLVGLDNPQSGDPKHALYPWPPNCTGYRLCQMMGLSMREYLHLFERDNLFPDCMAYGGVEERRRRATELVSRHLAPDRDVWMVACGTPVYGLLTTATPDKLEFMRMQSGDHHYHCAALPHPSGRNRWYNGPSNARQARFFLRGVAEAARRSRGV